MSRTQNQYNIGLDKTPANYVALSPLSFIARSAAVYPNHVSAVYERRVYTWAETYSRCRRFASYLSKCGIAEGDTPRLWVDMIAHVAMGRDKRVYRFVQDTRYGRRVIAESAEVDEMARAVTQYIARRLVERERVVAGDTELAARDRLIDTVSRRRRRRRTLLVLLLGIFLGVAIGAGAVLGTAWVAALH